MSDVSDSAFYVGSLRLEPEIYFLLVISGVIGTISVLIVVCMLIRYFGDYISNRRKHRRVGCAESGFRFYRRPCARNTKSAASNRSTTLAELDLERNEVGLDSTRSSLHVMPETRSKSTEHQPGDHSSELESDKDKLNLLDSSVLANIAKNVSCTYFVYQVTPNDYYNDESNDVIESVRNPAADQRAPSAEQVQRPPTAVVVEQPLRNADGLEAIPGTSYRSRAQSQQTGPKNMVIRSGLMSSIWGPVYRFLTSLLWKEPGSVQSSENEPSTVPEDIKRLTNPKSVGIITMLNFMQGEGNAHGILEEDRPDEYYIAPKPSQTRPKTAVPISTDSNKESKLQIKQKDSLPTLVVSRAESLDFGTGRELHPAESSRSMPKLTHAKPPRKVPQPLDDKCCCCC